MIIDEKLIELYYIDNENKFPLLHDIGSPLRSDRKSTKIDFQLVLSLQDYTIINKLSRISLTVTTDRGDNETLSFSNNHFRTECPECQCLNNTNSLLCKQCENKLINDELEKIQFRSATIPMKIGAQYRLDPGVILIFSDMKAEFKETLEDITQSIPINKSTIFLENKGKIGRFLDNIMAKLVFLSILTGIAGFLTEKSSLIDPTLSFWIEWISYGTIFLAIIVTIFFYRKEMQARRKQVSKRYLDN